VRDRTNQTLSRGAVFEILWGTIWLLGFLVSQFLPSSSASVLAWLWAGLGTVGGVISLGIGFVVSRRQTSVGKTSGSWFDSSQVRFGLFFCALVTYGGVLFALDVPLLLHAQHFGAQISLWWVVTFMFGYIAMGLWFRLPPLIGVGAAVTAIALLSYSLLPDYFYLVMALFGGGTLIGHGLFWLRPWRS
jgi:hypothetical protein